MRLGFWKPLTIYGCGNCRRSFKSEVERTAHYDQDGVCPQVTMERELAAWYERSMEILADRRAAAQEFGT